jgi:hypothetical protein
VKDDPAVLGNRQRRTLAGLAKGVPVRVASQLEQRVTRARGELDRRRLAALGRTQVPLAVE